LTEFNAKGGVPQALYLCSMKKQVKPPSILEGVNIVDMAHEGRGLGRHEGMVVLVDHAVPGDVVDVLVFRKKKSLAEGRIARLVSPSPSRTEPRCHHFGVCGGCKWQNLSYQSQLAFKEKQVSDQLTRLGQVTWQEFRPIIGATETYGYRNKMEYTFSNKKWLQQVDLEFYKNDELKQNMNALGFHIPQRFDKILHIDQCHLQAETGNAIRNWVYERAQALGLTFFDPKAQTGWLRNLVIRSSNRGVWMVMWVVSEDDIMSLNELRTGFCERFPEVESGWWVVNGKRNDHLGDLEPRLLWGKPYLEEEMEDLRFRVGPLAFFQTNAAQALRLYQETRALAGLTGNEVVYDLYTGTGTIAGFVARHARKVVGIEYLEAAVEDARANAALNGIQNAVFFAGDMKDVFSPDLIAREGAPDVVITDPPRAGMHESVVQRLLELRPKRIVYVSCNAATQARDLQLLSSLYQVSVVQPVDMFPQTAHVENIVRLDLKPL